MTDFAKKLQTLPKHVQLAIKERRGISYSRANTWQTCALWGKFKYILKYPDPVSDAILHGSAFDALTEGETPDFRGITPENQAIIEARAAEYYNEGLGIICHPGVSCSRQTQVPLYAELADGYWFYGWADDLLTFTGKPHDGVISLEDRKFSGKPWDKNRVKYNHKQAQCYIWALRQMGRDIREMTFRVGNLLEPGIQSFTYKPRAKSIAGIHDWLMEAARMPSQVIMPHGGHHCGICPYKVACDDVMWGSSRDLTNPES